jgi:hypothetical protein
MIVLSLGGITPDPCKSDFPLGLVQITAYPPWLDLCKPASMTDPRSIFICVQQEDNMQLRKLITAFGIVLLGAGLAHADLNDYIRSVNVSAEGNIGGYRTQLGVHYGASGPTLDLAFRSVDSPAEVAVLLWLGQRSSKPMETVVAVYKKQKGQGWGALAQSLGIKPGSADFHALKQGNLGWQPEESTAKGGGKGKGKK